VSPECFIEVRHHFWRTIFAVTSKLEELEAVILVQHQKFLTQVRPRYRLLIAWLLRRKARAILMLGIRHESNSDILTQDLEPFLKNFSITIPHRVAEQDVWGQELDGGHCN
jgi:hypothetical protein